MSNHYDPEFEAKETLGMGAVHVAQRKADQGEAVTRPAHYGGEANPFEPIKIIEHYQLGFHEGNVLKYLLRWRSKDGIKDLQKALYYLQRFVEREVKMQEKSKP